MPTAEYNSERYSRVVDKIVKCTVEFGFALVNLRQGSEREPAAEAG